MHKDSDNSKTITTDRAPIFGKWKYFYIFVVLWLIAMIGFFVVFSKWFS